jgi:hypothetical protein
MHTNTEPKLNKVKSRHPDPFIKGLANATHLDDRKTHLLTRSA